jgi:3-hydroxymyristoyl/3-hydroxydecanoyl-(acyl carrier protein) dehydratase
VSPPAAERDEAVIGACIPAGHPSLPGHFPGRPVVPGVVLLDEVVAAIGRWSGRAFVPAAFPSVKFLQPLLPAQAFDIHLRGNADRIEFECRRDGQVLVRGTVVGVSP